MSVILNRGTGVLELPAGQVRAVLGELLGEPGSGQALRRAGLLEATGAPGPALHRVARVIADPGCGCLLLVAGDRTMHGRIGGGLSVVVTPPDGGGLARVVPMGTGFLPKCVLRAAGLLSAGSTPGSRSPLTWTLSTSPAGQAGGGGSLCVVDNGRDCLAQDPVGGWVPVSGTDLYSRVAELVSAAMPHQAPAASRVGV